MDNVIGKAARRVPGHWYKGGLGDGKNFCGIGHVQNVLVEEYGFDGNHDIWHDREASNDFATAKRIMSEVARELFPGREDLGYAEGFAAFNDHQDTTEDDVVAVMEKAAVKWDERI